MANTFLLVNIFYILNGKKPLVFEGPTFHILFQGSEGKPANRKTLSLSGRLHPSFPRNP